MAIATLDQYIAAVKQRVTWNKLGSVTTVAAIPFTPFDQTGNPGTGALAGTSSANGVVPTDATAGFPAINFSSGTGYLSKIEFGNSVACRLHLFDMLFKAGTYAYNSGTTNLSSQPSFSGRCPDYTGGAAWGDGLEIWAEVTTAFATGNNWTVQVTYTNSSGTTGRSSGSANFTAASALTARKMFQLALASGDDGVQKIESVICTNGGTAMTAGAINILVMRPLYTNMRVPLANAGDIHDMLRTGLPIVYSDSALYPIVQADSTASGLPEMQIEIASA